MTEHHFNNLHFHYALDTGRIVVTGEIHDHTYVVHYSPLLKSLQDLQDTLIVEGGTHEDFFFDYLPDLTGGHCSAYGADAQLPDLLYSGKE